MRSIILGWGVPGFVTVVGGTALAIAMTGPNIASDLSERTGAALADPEFRWASVRFDARDAVISGTAPSQQVVDAAIAEVNAVHGVRTVTADVVVAEFASPYPFAARIDAAGIAVSGGVPDQTAHGQIVRRTAAASDQLRPLSGAPEREVWFKAVNYGLDHLELFDEGEVSLADLKLSIAGRARSADAYAELAHLSRVGLPPGVQVESREIAPALASPFEWRASFDGSTITVSGFTPSEEFAARLQAADFAGLPVSTSLVLASGEPREFERKAQLVLDNLLQLDWGSAVISGDEIDLVGAPPDSRTAELVTRALTAQGATVSLEPPRQLEYEFGAVRSRGTTKLSGLVPDAAALERLDALDNVDTESLRLARGAPERFESAVDFVLEALDRMSEGRASVKGTVIAIEGRAATLLDFAALETTIALGAPQGLMLGRTDVLPPLADPFAWSAEKSADGNIAMAGFVPSQRVRDALRAAIPDLASDTSTIADGEPEEFGSVARDALAVLQLLDTGKLQFDSGSWSLSGAVDTPFEAYTASSAFAAAGLGGSGWSYSVALPEPAPLAQLPLIDPYTWSARKRSGGEVVLEGHVPTAAARLVFAGRAGGAVIDNTELGAGAPETFISGALAGLDALAQLREGELEFTDGTWSLSGEIADPARGAEVEAALRAAVDTAAWRLAIGTGDAAPLVSPYRWSATKAADGGIAFAGHVVSEELRRYAAVRAGKVSGDTTTIASGAPQGFITDVLAGLDALAQLETGAASYENGAWTLRGTPPTTEAGAAALAALTAAADGGAGWKTSLSAPPATVAQVSPEAPAAAPATPIFTATKTRNAPIALSGAVPAEPARRWFGVIAGEVSTDAITIDAGLPPSFIPNAEAGVRALLEMSDGKFSFDGSNWVLTGRAATSEQRDAVLAGLGALSGDAWETDIALVPPIEICGERVAAFAARNAILFQSGSARMTEESAAALDELAGYLAFCPQATIHVEGHTDSDGADDLNLVLSVARAEAVVNALIARGVRADRLYAIGYGEGLPVASNDTRAGKQANRRIGFAVLDEHQ